MRRRISEPPPVTDPDGVEHFTEVVPHQWVAETTYAAPSTDYTCAHCGKRKRVTTRCPGPDED